MAAGRLTPALGSMIERIPKPMRLALIRAVGRTLGIACFAIGSTFRNRSLRAIGLPSVAERAFRRGNFDAASTRALQLLRIAEDAPNDWNYGISA